MSKNLKGVILRLIAAGIGSEVTSLSLSFSSALDGLVSDLRICPFSVAAQGGSVTRSAARLFPIFGSPSHSPSDQKWSWDDVMRRVGLIRGRGNKARIGWGESFSPSGRIKHFPARCERLSPLSLMLLTKVGCNSTR